MNVLWCSDQVPFIAAVYIEKPQDSAGLLTTKSLEAPLTERGLLA